MTTTIEPKDGPHVGAHHIAPGDTVTFAGDEGRTVKLLCAESTHVPNTNASDPSTGYTTVLDSLTGIEWFVGDHDGSVRVTHPQHTEV